MDTRAPVSKSAVASLLRRVQRSKRQVAASLNDIEAARKMIRVRRQLRLVK